LHKNIPAGLGLGNLKGTFFLRKVSTQIIEAVHTNIKKYLSRFRRNSPVERLIVLIKIFNSR
jgi:hypothetical protein